MALEDDMTVLARVILFSNFGEEQLRLIAFGAEPTELDKGRLLCREGETADGGFVLVSGRLGRFGENSEMVERSFGEPGTLIGELSLLKRTDWRSTIVAETKCRLLHVPRQLFLRILKEYPKTAADLHERIMGDFSTKVRLMEAVAKKLG
jgi:CRP-like cAMP-binding protein